MNFFIKEFLPKARVVTKPKISIVIPTYNHSSEPVKTITRILDVMRQSDELIIVDQNSDFEIIWKNFRNEIIKDERVRIFDLKPPGTPLARTVGGIVALADIILYIDDDMDIEQSTITEHLKYYENPAVGGVAGGIDGEYSNNNKVEYTRAAKGGHMSFRKKVFEHIRGFDTNINGNFSAEETEFCERVRVAGYKIVRGLNCTAYHRAPVIGGAGNQGGLTLDWYYKTYCNHFYWMFKRKGFRKVLLLPWHLQYLIRFFRPNLNELMSKRYLYILFNSIKEGRKRAKRSSLYLKHYDEVKTELEKVYD